MKFRILLLFCLLSSSLCPAKERQLIFRSFNADNGLAHNTVLAVIQDRTGFMWFGTKDGLNRYDGSEIRTVAVTDAIPGNNYSRRCARTTRDAYGSEPTAACASTTPKPNARTVSC